MPHTSSMSARWVVLFLSLLLGLQPVATDLYLPALPALTLDLGASMSQAQLTLTAMLLAFGFSQLVWGPVSDRWGRRPVLIVGMGLFALAALGSVWAASVQTLIVWRALQGVAMGAAVMGARAIVRDVFNPVDAARAMSKGLTGLGVIACITAPLGGWLSDQWGWRMALASLAVFGALTCMLLVWRFEETLRQRNPQALQWRVLLRTWRSIGTHPTFWAYALLTTTSYCGLFTFLAASSFVFIDVLGESKTAYGLWLTSMSVAYIIGTFGCRRLIVRWGVQRTVAVAGGLTLISGGTMAALAWAGVHSVWAIMLPFYGFMLAHGVHQPCGQSGSVSPFPQAAGSASSLSGFMMMVAAFGVGTWLGVQLSSHGGGSVLPLTNGIGFWSVLIAATAWTVVQRHGQLSRT
jgi:DHA1 family bicyclomycin/chloramphenicol resistance-like MFS transporter